MDYNYDDAGTYPLERCRSFDEEPKQPHNIPNGIERALQNLNQAETDSADETQVATTTTTTKATATTRKSLTRHDVKYLFSGAPQFMLEKGRHNRWYPHVLFPWDEGLPIQDLWDRERLRHESFTLSTLHAHLPVPTRTQQGSENNAAAVADATSSRRRGWEYEEGVARSTYDLGIFEVPNMLSANGKEPGAVGFRHYLELATADSVRYRRATPAKGSAGKGEFLDQNVLSNMPLTDIFDTLSHLRDAYSLCNFNNSVLLDRHKLICEGPATWKRIGVRDANIQGVVERLERLSNFRLRAVNKSAQDKLERNKALTILDFESAETLHKQLYSNFLFPPPRGWAHHEHEDLKGQIEVIARVLAVKGAWIDLSLPEWRLRVGQVLWEMPPHADGDCLDCIKSNDSSKSKAQHDNNNNNNNNNKGKHSSSCINRGLERKWLLIQLLLAGELLVRLDAIVQLAVLQQSKTLSVTAQDMRELDKLRHGKVNWDILFFQRVSDNLIFKFVSPATLPKATDVSKQSDQENKNPPSSPSPSSPDAKVHNGGFRARFNSISQHLPLRRPNFARPNHETGHDTENSTSTSIWDSVIILPRRPERQLRGLAVFAEKIGWPDADRLEANIRLTLLQQNGDTTQVLSSDSLSSVYAVPVTNDTTPRKFPQKEAYCRSAAHRYVVLHEPNTTADDSSTSAGGWLSRAWLTGLVMPGESIHQLLMATLLENDPAAVRSLGTVANMYGGFTYGDNCTWWSTKCIVGRVLAALPGSKVCMGWVKTEITPKVGAVKLQNTWITVDGVQEALQKNIRIRQGITVVIESNPLGKGKVASDTFTLPVDKDEKDGRELSDFDVKVDAIMLSSQQTPTTCCGSDGTGKNFVTDAASISFRSINQDSSPIITLPLRYNVAFISSYTCQPPRGSVTYQGQHNYESGLNDQDNHQRYHPFRLPGHPLHTSYHYKYVSLSDLRPDTVPPLVVFSSSYKESSSLPQSSQPKNNQVGKEKEDRTGAEQEHEHGEETYEPIWILDARSPSHLHDKEVFARAWCAAVGVHALVGRATRTCLACCIREARAIGVGVVIRV